MRGGPIEVARLPVPRSPLGVRVVALHGLSSSARHLGCFVWRAILF
jgi:hypothetical protein